MRPITLFESISRCEVSSAKLAVTPNGIGRKSGDAAASLASSKSIPAASKSATACSREIQPSTSSRSMFPPGVRRSSCSPVQEPLTTSHGYPAGPVS